MKKKMKPSFAITALIIIFVIISGVWAWEPRTENVSGKYVREAENESARLEVKLLPDGKVHIRGMALWGTGRKYGPNIGELDFKAPLKKGRVEYSERIREGQHYRLELTFTQGGLSAKEEGISTNFGMNVKFAGEYKKK